MCPAFDITDQITLALWVNPRDIGNGQDNEWLGKDSQELFVCGLGHRGHSCCLFAPDSGDGNTE